MTKTEVGIAKFLIANYHELTKTKEYVPVYMNTPFNAMQLATMLKRDRLYKPSRAISLREMKPIHCDLVFATRSWGMQDPKSKYSYSTFKAGVSILTFNDDSVALYASYTTGYASNIVECTMMVCSRNTHKKLTKYLASKMKRASKPKPGIYIAHDVMGQLILQPINRDKLTQIDVEHHRKKEFEHDIDFFFNNMDIFTRFNQPGNRKVLLAGPPGTGKTSIAVETAIAREKDTCIAFCNNLGLVAQFQAICAAHKMKGIGILEDAEGSLGSNSETLNFLDGVKSPRNPEGFYLIMTSNHPERIEDNILKRPGRIDKNINIDALRGKLAVKCLQFYLKPVVKRQISAKNLSKWCNDVTGAELKELVNIACIRAAQSRGDITSKLLEGTLEEMRESMRGAEKLGLEDRYGKRDFGFSQPGGGQGLL